MKYDKLQSCSRCPCSALRAHNGHEDGLFVGGDGLLRFGHARVLTTAQGCHSLPLRRFATPTPRISIQTNSPINQNLKLRKWTRNFLQKSFPRLALHVGADPLSKNFNLSQDRVDADLTYSLFIIYIIIEEK